MEKKETPPIIPDLTFNFEPTEDLSEMSNNIASVFDQMKNDYTTNERNTSLLNSTEAVKIEPKKIHKTKFFHNLSKDEWDFQYGDKHYFHLKRTPPSSDELSQ